MNVCYLAIKLIIEIVILNIVRVPKTSVEDRPTAWRRRQIGIERVRVVRLWPCGRPIFEGVIGLEGDRVLDALTEAGFGLTEDSIECAIDMSANYHGNGPRSTPRFGYTGVRTITRQGDGP